MISNHCPNCVTLQAQLDVARDELSNGIHVLNERERQSREREADKDRQLADVYAALKVTTEGELVARLAELLAK